MSTVWNGQVGKATCALPLPTSPKGAPCSNSTALRKFGSQASRDHAHPRPPLRLAKKPISCFRLSAQTPQGTVTCRNSQRRPLSLSPFSQLNRSSSATQEHHRVRNLKSTEERQKVHEPVEVTTKSGAALCFNLRSGFIPSIRFSKGYKTPPIQRQNILRTATTKLHAAKYGGRSIFWVFFHLGDFPLPLEANFAPTSQSRPRYKSLNHLRDSPTQTRAKHQNTKDTFSNKKKKKKYRRNTSDTFKQNIQPNKCFSFLSP